MPQDNLICKKCTHAHPCYIIWYYYDVILEVSGSLYLNIILQILWIWLVKLENITYKKE